MTTERKYRLSEDEMLSAIDHKNRLMHVKKLDNTKAVFDYTKIANVLNIAAAGLHHIDLPYLQRLIMRDIYDDIETRKILQIIINHCKDLISAEHPDYQYMAGRCYMMQVYKEVYGSHCAPSLFEYVQKMVSLELYDSRLLEHYTEAEWHLMNSYLKHHLDQKFTYSAVGQLVHKFLLKNRVTYQLYETPQMMFMLIAATFFFDYGDKKLHYIRAFYDALSSFKISLPTPILSSARTNKFQFSSCVLIDVGDSIDSIAHSGTVIMKYISSRAGIGLNIGRIRPIGSPIANASHVHSGVIPFIKYFQAAIRSCSQGGVRIGAGTLFFPIWHKEVLDLLVLKNNRGSEDNRARHVDYGVQINKLFYQRLLNQEHITLLNSYDVPGLYDAFFADQELFAQLYVAAEQNPHIEKQTILATDLFANLALERAQTGRIYIQNVDHCNEFSAFNKLAPSIKGSNLCMEITLPTTPVTADDHSFEVALCTLSAINLGNIENLAELESLSDLIVRALDNAIEYQNYRIPASKIVNLRRRPLGIGVTNFAYYLAKNGVKYDDGSANNLVHLTFEHLQYYLLKASNRLAQERGACAAFHETKYADGILPIDNYRRSTDKIHNQELVCDWELLRSSIAQYGLRNSTLSAIMPCESSSLLSNATNGIEPPRGYVSIKQNKNGTYSQVIPGIEQYKDQYQLLWNIKNNTGYLEICALIQKFIDHSISANTNYDPQLYPNQKVPLELVLQDMIYAYKMGLKTLYYHNTRDQSDFDSYDCGCNV
jgi:ribonucleoside-diphosphate reductase alpha chain